MSTSKPVFKSANVDYINREKIKLRNKYPIYDFEKPGIIQEIVCKSKNTALTTTHIHCMQECMNFYFKETSSGAWGISVATGGAKSTTFFYILLRMLKQKVINLSTFHLISFFRLLYLILKRTLFLLMVFEV